VVRLFPPESKSSDLHLTYQVAVAKPKAVAAFCQEVRNSKVEWEMIFYGNAEHSFTDSAAGMDNSQGTEYTQVADRDHWEAMKEFFREMVVVERCFRKRPKQGTRGANHESSYRVLQHL
jgi:hypothetical protein